MLNNIASKLDGYKTVLGLIAGVAYMGLVAMGVIDRSDLIETLIAMVTGVGVAHKFAKASDAS